MFLIPHFYLLGHVGDVGDVILSRMGSKDDPPAIDLAVTLNSRTRRSIRELALQIMHLAKEIFNTREGLNVLALCDRIEALVMVIREQVKRSIRK